MRSRWNRWAVWAVALAVLAAGGIAVAEEQCPCCVLTVSRGHNLQHAIDMAPEGAILELQEVTWTTGIRITKSLTLRGQGAEDTIIRSVTIAPPEDGREIEVVIEDLSVVGATTGIRAEGNASVTIRRTDIYRNNRGIELWGTVSATIEDCKIFAHTGTGVYLVQDFAGYVAGRATFFLGNASNYSHEELSFLETDEGGELDLRE